MESARPFVVVRTADQWRRASHRGTDLDESHDHVTLAEVEPAEGHRHGAVARPCGGLAFDGGCRLYYGLVADGRVERILWGAIDPLKPHRKPAAQVLLGAAADAMLGDFSSIAESDSLLEPRGLAVDEQDRLLVADAAQNRLLVYDLTNRRLLRAARFAPAGGAALRPLDVACHGATAFVLTEHASLLFTMTATGEAALVPLRREGVYTRLAISPSGRLALLDASRGGAYFPSEDRFFRFVDQHGHSPEDLQDLEFESDDVLVLARSPGRDFLRLPVGPHARKRRRLIARGYDGGGIVRAPDGRIGYLTPHGYRSAIEYRPSFIGRGRVTTYRLDSGAWQTKWGRVFVDACIASDTDVRVHFLATDTPPELVDPEEKLPPNCASVELAYPDASPPKLAHFLGPSDAEFSPLHARGHRSELPWAPDPVTPFNVYEAPIAQQGRYLFVSLLLVGNTRQTPMVRGLRAEYPGHDYLRRLPRAFSRDAAGAGFLERYLAMFAGFLGEVESKSATRATLLHPAATREELLPWLASFLGLVFDERFRVAQRRVLLAEIADLWRARGTLSAIRRWLEIYLGFTPMIVENFRTRGPGGAVLGDRDGPLSSIAGTFRVGGPIEAGNGTVARTTVERVFASYAHRFTVIVPMVLDDEQRDVVATILDQQRPAHTTYELCVASEGMRIGMGLHVALTTVLGPASGFQAASLGSWWLGTDQIVGRPGTGMIAGITELGTTSEVG